MSRLFTCSPITPRLKVETVDRKGHRFTCMRDEPLEAALRLQRSTLFERVLAAPETEARLRREQGA